MSKPVYLILGGVGFTGRNIVEQLIDNDLAELIIVVDKLRPELSWLTGNHKQCFQNEKVVFKQKNTSNPATIREILDSHKIDYVINCVTESRNGMTPEVYDQCIFKSGVACAKEVAKTPSVKRFVQLSTGEVYASSKEAKAENGKIGPWTKSAQSFLSLEKELASIPKTAFAYGIGDRIKITPRIIITSVYKILNETMSLLWNKGLLMNTVHVRDVARAALFLCDHGDSGSIFNIVDKSKTTQGSLTATICEIYPVKYSFVGKIESTVVFKLDIGNVCEEINSKHTIPWFDACQKESIDATPLSPYIHKELLNYNHLSMDGSKIESLGFTYKYPTLTKELLREIIDDLHKNKMLPEKCMP